MVFLKFILPVLIAALLFLSGCSRQQPMPAIPDATIAIMETTAPSIHGDWVLDYDTTEANLQSYESLQTMFGTGLQEGSGMTVGADGAFRFFIGVGQGGEGSYVFDGTQLDAEITPYVDGETSLPLSVVTQGENTFLVMEYDGEMLYWKRA